MLNVKYLRGVFLYFFSNNDLEYVFLFGFYYLLQDYFILIFSFFKDFTFLSSFYKENVKFIVFTFVFLACLI